MKLTTRIRSMLMRYISSEGYQQRRQRGARRRRDAGKGPVIHYFHSVSDPFSALTVQCIGILEQRYAVTLTCHLVSAAKDDFIGDHLRHDAWARADAGDIASAYGLSFPLSADADSLAWRLARQAQDPGVVAQGDALRARWGHYASALFYFEGEWYWGVDRLRVLEARLINEGLSRLDPPVPAFPEPQCPRLPDLSDTDIVLEYFPSLRSPYTAVGHHRLLDLVAATGVRTVVRPVLPMMMRGVPAPASKGRQILFDAGREGRFFKAPLGRIVDPFGEPIRLAYAYLPALQAAGLLMPFVTEYLRAAWVDGVDITSQRGLTQVLVRAGLDPATPPAPESQWMALVGENLELMQGHDLWGVPSFRVTGAGQPAFACWGQDRIWRVARELRRRAGATRGDDD